MNAMSSLSDILFPAAGGFVETDYFAFFAQRVPKDIAEQLRIDCSPELGASTSIDIHDVIRPLSSHAFPASELWELADILSYTIICYTNVLGEEPARHDPYKLIYCTSLYLYCFVHGKGPGGGAYLAALGMLANASAQLDLETRLQVCRFLGFLIPAIFGEAVGPASATSALSFEAAPISSVLIALSVVVGSIASDLSMMVENTIKNEKIVSAWGAEEVPEGTPSYDGVSILKRWASMMYGPSGKVREVADRFLLGIEGEKESVAKDGG